MTKLPKSTKKNVVTFLGNNEFYCCGCGVCAGICPVNCLSINFNNIGEYNPELIAKCTECGICLKVCPSFNAGSIDEVATEIFSRDSMNKRDGTLGNYQAFYVGHILNKESRLKSASGGLLTHVIDKLVRNREVDSASVVLPVKQEEALFKVFMAKDGIQIQQGRGTKYYPVEFSGALAHIIENPGSYAITALPCVALGIRRACTFVPKLRERIKFVFGLTCGHGVGKGFTEFLLHALGIKATDVNKINYRNKIIGKMASDFSFKVVTESRVAEIQSQRTAYGILYGNRYFVPVACDYCDDVFAETADAVFMDAWLDPYKRDACGTSIVIARNRSIVDLLHESAKDDEIEVNEIPLEDVLKSQSSAIRSKRNVLSARLHRDQIKWNNVRCEPSLNEWNKYGSLVERYRTNRTLSERYSSEVGKRKQQYFKRIFRREVMGVRQSFIKRIVRKIKQKAVS